MNGVTWKPNTSDGEAHICSLGIFGTPYVRDEPLVTTIEVTQGDTPTTLTVPDVYPKTSIDTAIDVSVRQSDSATLSFVTLERLQGETLITINASEDIAVGDYDLILESFD